MKKLLINLIKLYFAKKKWRKLNGHNFTTINRIFPFEVVKVGKMSYGPLNIYHWGNNKEKLIIGNFVSISSDVKFLLGGNHYTDTFSTYPFKVKMFKEETEAWTKGSINIADDVWIGMGATILSGVKVGQGAVIASNSVVTKNIKPYSVVAGNPAKVVKMRFDTDVIDELISADFNLLSNDIIFSHIEELYQPFDLKNPRHQNLINSLNGKK